MNASPSLVLFFALILSPCGAPVLAQDAPIKWGRIPQEHLEMKTFPADTNAAAVILADYGTVSFDNSYAPTLKRHRRIKILSEAGFDWGTFSVTYLAEGRKERVRKVAGQTFILGEDGKVERHKRGRRDIFDEDVNGSLRRTRLLEDGTLRHTRVLEVRQTRLPPDEFDEFREFLAQVARSDRAQVVLVEASE